MFGFIGDIHGEFDKFKFAVDHLREMGANKIVLTGDLVDRGMFSAQVLKFVMESPDIFTVIGNHDIMAFSKVKRRCDFHEWVHWTHQGGKETLESYSKVLGFEDYEKCEYEDHTQIRNALLEDLLKVFKPGSWDYFLIEKLKCGKTILVTHAPLSDYGYIMLSESIDKAEDDEAITVDIDSVTWNRTLPTFIPKNQIRICGHTVVNSPVIETLGEGTLCMIDTGAVFGRPLTYLTIDDEGTITTFATPSHIKSSNALLVAKYLDSWGD